MRVTFGVLVAAAAMVSVGGTAQAQAQAVPVRDGYCATVMKALDPNGDGETSDQDLALAAKAAEACIAADPPQGLVSRAAVHLAAERGLRATADVDAALAASPQYAPALRMKCDLTTDPKQAKPFCDRAVAAAPGWARARMSQAVSLAQNGDAAGAMKGLDEAARLDPAWGQPLVLRALMKFQRGDREGGWKDVTAAQAAEPHAGNLLLIGSALESLEMQEEALALYDWMLQAGPRHPGVLRARANLLLQAGDADRAIADLTALTELQPRDGWPLAMRGAAYSAKNDAARAEADMRKAVAVDPEPGEWMINLARLQSVNGRSAESRATIAKALALTPQTATIRGSYADLLAQEGRPFSAVAELRKAADLAEQAGAFRASYDQAVAAYAEAAAEAYEAAYGFNFFKTADRSIASNALREMESKCLDAYYVRYANEYAYFWERAGRSAEKADQLWNERIAKDIDFQVGCLNSINREFQTAYAKFQQDVKADYARAAQAWVALESDCAADQVACAAARNRGKAAKAKLDATVATLPAELKTKYDEWLKADNVRAVAKRSRAAFLEKPGEYDYKSSRNYETARSVGGFTGG